MKCKTCPTRNFVHADMYCKRCEHKPRPKIKTGRAYLFIKNSFKPITSVEVKAPKGLEYEYSAVELMSHFRIEFISD